MPPPVEPKDPQVSKLHAYLHPPTGPQRTDRQKLLSLDSQTSPYLEDESRVRRRGEVAGQVATHTTDSLARSRTLLMDTLSRSTVTLEQLGSSSSTIGDTQEELLVQKSTIGTSSSLLAKYGRREWTDKLLIFMAFLMFIGVVLYVVRNRFF